jgi:MSHA biogenesis protein MshE
MQVGSLLIRDSVITSEQLDEALGEKERSGTRVGDILVERGWATTADLARALAEQWNLEFVDILTTEVEPEAVKLLSEPVARRYRALPIRYLSKNLVLVAISDPTDILGPIWSARSTRSSISVRRCMWSTRRSKREKS